MICHLIGLNHCYQYRGYRGVDWKAFDAYLFSLCRNAEVHQIAEELSEESVKRWAFRGAKGSVAKAVALRLGIGHRFCDPSPVDRKALGILSTDEIKIELDIGFAMTDQQTALLDSRAKEFWPVRELFWIEKLQDEPVERCVFILGAEHVDSFSALLSLRGIEVKIEHRNWKP